MTIKQAKKYLDDKRYDLTFRNWIQEAYEASEKLVFKNDDDRTIWVAEYVIEEDYNTAY